MSEENEKFGVYDLIKLPGKLWARISTRFPSGLFPRALIIIVAPMVLLQSVIALVFMERHWQQVSRQLSRTVAQDVSAVVSLFEQDPSQKVQITDMARRSLNMRIEFLPYEKLPAPSRVRFFNVLEYALSQQMTNLVQKPYEIDTQPDTSFLSVKVDIGDEILFVEVRKSSVYAANSHIFLVWMLLSSLVLLGIAILFLRNQITPILRLSKAMERFGKGQGIAADFSPRGAREVRLASKQFLLMSDRLERQMGQRTTMLAGVSHDLRTVLTRFKLQLALLGSNDQVKDLETDVSEMEKMLQGYLDFVSGHADEVVVEVHLHDALSKYANEAKLREVKFSLNCDESIKALVRPSSFSRLMDNLLSNAFRYADEVVVSVDKGAVETRIAVDDNGPGIGAESRAEAFKPFSRLDAARNLDHSGTGLGLAIAKDIVMTHGGQIELQDSDLGGLSVVINLPK